MVTTMQAAFAVAIVAFAATLGVLTTLFRAQLRGYDRAVAADLLDEWAATYAADPLAVPSAEVLAAMVRMPVPARSVWDRMSANLAR
ncbi:hypothetical protein [Actinoplanes sp. URMC 104]|uniref:hypothetical protein n=1 Tax=Actinoplanes sp. URMC 104 TaxID=3423409 RepID=UPI003F1C95BA